MVRRGGKTIMSYEFHTIIYYVSQDIHFLQKKHLLPKRQSSAQLVKK
jgi:hypothetical protein